HLQNVPYDYHKHTSTGDLVQRCTSDVDTVRRFISLQLLEIVRTVFMMTVAIVIMFSLHTKMALISMAVLPFLCVFSFAYFKRVRKHFTLSDEAEGRMSAVLQENLTGVRVVRAFGQQQSEMEKFTECNRHYKKVTYRMIKLLGYYWGLSDMMGYSQIAITLIAGIYFAATSDFTLGNILLFTTYTNMLTWPVRQLGRTLADLGKASVSLGRIDEILSAPAEQEPGAALEHPICGNVEFRNVCFGYDSPDEVLKGISFTAKPGETVAILGATGSGKSSLVHLLQRLYLCTDGEILIDGVNINDIHRHILRKNIGIVLQEPFLYSRTIAENICIVRPDATAEEMHETARTAAIHDVIMEFENGYDTVVGERGVTLSGGQKQRVAIARTLMQRAPILIFDDSMSAVDTETDAAIRKALLARKQHSTTFIISHRITTLSGADKILVLEGGRLVQQGTHEELLRQEGLYARIAGIQTMLEQDLEGGDEA
ncbi:MAG: ABC transporter ATP-binding protein, partial [Clostridia bacterium]|nr:ABC transporter ATP-binding protein [Clostridia bacterium]